MKHRLMARAMNAMSRMQRGYETPFLDVLLEQRGVVEGMKCLLAIDRLAEEVHSRFGERDGHWVLAVSSMWNGCDHCSIGHAFAGNLAHFDAGSELFPVDERELGTLMEKRDAEVVATLSGRLEEAGFERLAGLTRRALALREGEPPQGADDELLLECLRAYEWMNYCSVTPQPPESFEPLSARAKDGELRRRYRAAREA